MLRGGTALLATVAVTFCALVLPAAAPAASRLAPPQPPNSKPPGFKLTRGQAIEIAGRTPEVREERTKRGGLYALTEVPLGTKTWQVGFYSRKTEVARALVDARTGSLIGPVYTGPQVRWPAARGVKTAFRDRVDYSMVVLCLVFLLPFVDLRRPLRLLHLDLLALLGYVVSLMLLQTGHLELSVWLQYVPFLYLLPRLAWAGFRGRSARDAGPLVPYASSRVLALGLVALVVARLAFNVGWSLVGDVGYAGVFGADGLIHGYHLYGNSTPHLDAYGPVNYYFYIPFVALSPLGPGWSHVEGAHVASLMLDVAVIVLLMLLGRRLAAGRAGRRLGLALGYAWAAYPLGFFPLALNSNDGLVVALVLVALLLYGSPVGRAVVLGLGAAAKFSPLALVPIFALGRERSWRNGLLVCGLATLLFVALFIPYVRQSGLQTVWDSTVGFQMNRGSPFTLWGLHPSLEWLHVVIGVVAIGLIAAASWFPRDRSLVAIAALSAAVLLAVQMSGTYWAHTYVAWFAAPAVAALFALQSGARAPTRAAVLADEKNAASSGGSSQTR